MSGWRNRLQSKNEIAGDASPTGIVLDLPIVVPPSFDAVFDQYWDALFRYCHLRLGSWEDAEDAAQNVLLAVSKRMGGFTQRAGEGSFRSWIFTIAHNETIDWHRKRVRRPEAPLSEIFLAADPGPTPEETAVASWEHRWLREQFAQLSPDQRAVLELRLADLTSREIAAVLEMSHDNVRKLQERAELKLRVLATDKTGGRNVH